MGSGVAILNGSSLHYCRGGIPRRWTHWRRLCYFCRGHQVYWNIQFFIHHKCHSDTQDSNGDRFRDRVAKYDAVMVSHSFLDTHVIPNTVFDAFPYAFPYAFPFAIPYAFPYAVCDASSDSYQINAFHQSSLS